MKRLIVTLAVASGAVLTAAPASAHHSVTGIFMVDRVVTLEGMLTDIDWINPHIYFHMMVKEKDGSVSKWRFESLPPAFMRRAGLTKELFMESGGQPVKMTFGPPRDPANKTGFAVEITYADGHSYQIGPKPPAGGAPAAGAPGAAAPARTGGR